jgi:hypothetical protein
MSAIKNQPKKSSDKRSLLIVSGILVAIGISLFAYLMFYTAPAEVMERVQVIAVTESGSEGSYVVAPVDQKAKDRAAAMNPTN